MPDTTALQRRAALSALPVLALTAASPAVVAAALDDPNSVITVMQFFGRSEASRAELKLRMAAMCDHLRAKPGLVENALFENRNTAAKPHYVGVSRLKSLKNWENLCVPFSRAGLTEASVGALGIHRTTTARQWGTK